MAEDRAYRSADLTVASLAQRLAVPEYWLRRLINQRFGHRHFSAWPRYRPRWPTRPGAPCRC